MSAIIAPTSVSHVDRRACDVSRSKPTGVIHRLIPAVAVGSLAIGFALYMGLEVGISNHLQYLLHGLHAADPDFLAGDWFTTQTPDHHHLFSLLVQSLAANGVLHVGLGLLNGASSVAYALAIYFIIARFSSRPLAPYACAIILLAFLPITGPGHTHILLPYFVPSVLSGVLMLVAFALLLNDRVFAAGIVAALSCATHANYLLLIAPVWFVYIALSPRRDWKRLVLALFIPWLVSWAPHIQMILNVLNDPSDPMTIRRIFWEYYVPIHYNSSSWATGPLVRYAAVLGCGAVAACVMRRQLTSSAFNLTLAVATVFVAGAFGTMVLDSEFFTNLFTWRFGPFLTIAAAVSMALLLDFARVAADWPKLLAFSVSAVVLRWTELDERAMALLALLILGVALMTIWDWFALKAASRNPELPGRLVLMMPAIQNWVFCSIIIFFAALGVRSGLWRKDMFSRPINPDAAALYEWCRNTTPPGTQFIVPPDLTSFRLETGRAILVDYKCIAYQPIMQLEWYRRMTWLCGEAPTGYNEAASLYLKLSNEDAMLLQREFGSRYVVVDRYRHTGDLSELRTVFQACRFQVLELPVGESEKMPVAAAISAPRLTGGPAFTNGAAPRR